MNQSWSWIRRCSRGVYHRNAAIGGEPNASLRVRDNRSVSLYTLCSKQAIFGPVLANVPVAERATHQAAAFHLQYMTGRCNPKPSVFVFRHSKYRLVQRVRTCARYMNLFVTEEGQASSSSDPQHAIRISQEAIHIWRRKTVASGISAPAIFRERAQAIWRAKPHCPVSVFCNRGHGV